MKKIAMFSTAIICSLFLLESCDNNDCDVLIDPAPTPVCIILKDVEGNNLLDAEFERNILGNDIEVEFNGETYPLILSEYDNTSYEKMKLHIGKIGEDNVPGIMFWYFFIGRDKGGSEFSIDWGDGTSDDIKFDFYYKVVKCEPESHMRIYLNGDIQSDNSLVATIVK